MSAHVRTYSAGPAVRHTIATENSEAAALLLDLRTALRNAENARILAGSALHAARNAHAVGTEEARKRHARRPKVTLA